MSTVIEINHDKCVGCGLCVKDCPNKAIELDNKKANMTADKCMECGHCVAICPRAAVSMNGYDMTESIAYDKESFEIDADNFLNKIKFRRSIRQFQNKEVEHEKLEKIIEAGRFTPTGSNEQHVRYVVVEKPGDKIEPLGINVFSKLIKAARVISKVKKLSIDPYKYEVKKGFFFHDAPAVIFVISDDVVDAALASANMGTMAEAQGLGIFYVGLFVRAARMSKKIRKELNMTKKEKLVTAIAVGYPSVKYQRTVPRKKTMIEWR